MRSGIPAPVRVLSEQHQLEALQLTDPIFETLRRLDPTFAGLVRTLVPRPKSTPSSPTRRRNRIDLLMREWILRDQDIAFAGSSEDGEMLLARITRGWRGGVLNTWSERQASGYLGQGATEVRALVGSSRLQAITVRGANRFPRWQFIEERDRSVLPHLEDVLAQAVAAGWRWDRLALLMTQPQDALPSGGHRHSPAAWLRDGGSAQRVLNLIAQRDTSHERRVTVVQNGRAHE